MADNRRRKKRRKKKKSRKIVLFVFEILLLAILLVAAYFIGMVNRVKYENMSETEAGINDDLSKDTLESLVYPSKDSKVSLLRYLGVFGRIYQYCSVWSG